MWRWSKGAALLGQFGDPTATTDYSLCVYDRSGGVASLAMAATIPAGGTCGTRPCWKAISSGYKYKNGTSGGDGVRSVLLKGSSAGNAKLQIKAKGDALPLPTPVGAPFFHQDPSVTAQLVNSAGFCWEATYSAPAQRNQGGFKDKSD